MRKIICILLAAAVISAMSITALAEGIVWNNDGETLTVSGTGEMDEVQKCDSPMSVKVISIEEGVESILPSAFEEYSNAEVLYLPQSLKYIGENAFKNCTFAQVYYFGTGKDYLAIEICGGNEALMNAEEFNFSYDYPSYGVEDAYWECAAQYPDFVDRVKAADEKGRVTDESLINFFNSVYRYFKNEEDNLDKSEFDSAAVDSVIYAMNRHIYVRNALQIAFPDAVVEAQNGIISDDLKPVYNAVKRAVFEHKLVSFTPKIKILDKEEDGTINLKLLNIDKTDETVIIVSLYDEDGVLKSVYRKIADKNSLEQTVQADSDYSRLKIFVFESMTSLKPMCNGAE
jgi:hypothetical protein